MEIGKLRHGEQAGLAAKGIPVFGMGVDCVTGFVKEQDMC